MRLALNIILVICIALPNFSQAQCNGSKNLCYKRYSDVSFLISNNAYSPFEDMMLADQSQSIAEQLQGNVDGLLLNVGLHFGAPVVFYRSPFIGQVPLADVLATIKQELKEDPERILTLIVESDLDNSAWSPALEKSGITKFMYAHGGGQWPVLRDMIDNNTRLVVFSNKSSSNDIPGLHNLNTMAMRATTDLCKTSCDELYVAADSQRQLLVMDHHMELKVSEKIDDLVWINSKEVLFGRALQCWDRTGNIPNFVLVDHYQIGQTRVALDMINNLTDGLAENVDPRNFEIMKDPLMDYSTIDFRGFIRKDHVLEIFEVGGMQVASVENAEYPKMYIPKMALAFGTYQYRVLDPNDEEILQGQFLIN